MNKYIYIAVILLLVSVALRLNNLDEPLGGVGGTAAGNYMMTAKNYDRYGWLMPVNAESNVHLIVPPLYSWILRASLFLGESELIARMPSVIFGLASIALMYLLIKEFYNKKMAILSAVLFSLIPVHIMTSRDVIADIALVFFMLLTTYFFALYCNRKRPVYIYTAAAAMAMALFTKQPAAALFLPFAFALWKIKLLNRHAVAAALVAFLPIAVFSYAHPSFVVHFFSAVGGQAYEAFFPFKVAYTLVYSFSPFILLLSMLGLLYAIKNPDWKNSFWAIWFIVYAVFFAFRMPPDHAYYALPLVPAAAVLSGLAISEILKMIKLDDSFMKISFYVIAAVIIVSIIATDIFVLQVTHFRDDRVSQLRDYLNTVTTNGTKIAIMNDGGNVPLIAYYLDRSVVNTNRTNPVYLKTGKEPIKFYQYGKLKESDLNMDAEYLITSPLGMPEFLEKWLANKSMVKAIEVPEISMLMFKSEVQPVLVYRLS